MFCAKCGKSLPDSVKFCTACGTGVLPQDSPTVPFLPPVPQQPSLPPQHPQSSQRPQPVPANRGAAGGGYVSEEARRRYSIVVGLIGIAFFAGQLILPMVFGFAFMFKSMLSMKEVVPQKGVYYEGKIFLTQRSDVAINGETQSTSSLCSFDPGAKKLPKDFCVDMDIDDPWLLPGTDRLWLLSRDQVGHYINGKVDTFRLPSGTGDLSKPFLLDGHLAVLENSMEGLFLMTYLERGWVRSDAINIVISKDDSESIRNYIQAVEANNILYFFRYKDGKVYAREGFPNGDTDGWEEVFSAYSGENWKATVYDGAPAVFCDISKQSVNIVKGYRLENGKWREILERNMGMVMDYGAVPMNGDRAMLLIGSTPGSFKSVIYDHGVETSSIQYEGGFGNMMTGMMLMIYLPMFLSPVIMSLILAPIMGKNRVCDYVSAAAPEGVRYASLSRRAIAQLIDIPFIMGPMIFGYIRMFSGFKDMETFSVSNHIFAGFGMIFGGLIWTLLALFIFSYTEGKWGATPGKLAVGIKTVGVDLAPCGFGRGLLRNILMVADGFFVGLVGVMLVAFTDDWQRVGDMAARTIVIRTR